MADVGARMLAKALQVNTTLQTLYIDQNAITTQGFTDIARALERSVISIRVIHCSHQTWVQIHNVSIFST